MTADQILANFILQTGASVFGLTDRHELRDFFRFTMTLTFLLGTVSVVVGVIAACNSQWVRSHKLIAIPLVAIGLFIAVILSPMLGLALNIGFYWLAGAITQIVTAFYTFLLVS